MRPLAAASLILVIGAALAGTQPSDDPIPATAPIDRGDKGLLDFLRRRTLGKVEKETTSRLVKELASEKKEESDTAMRHLVALGHPASGVLRESLKDANLVKLKPKMEECLKWIDGPSAPDLTKGVVRALGRRKPAGTVGVLIAFVASGTDEDSADEARSVLASLAIRDKKFDVELEEAALKDAVLSRRNVAVEIVAQSDARHPPQMEVIRKLYRDGSRDIRLRTCIGRLEQADVEAVEMLIELMAEPTSAEAKAALEALQRIVGPFAAEPALAAPPRRDAWAAWWKGTTGDSILKYFRDRTPNTDPDKIAEVVALLGSKSFKVRQKAETDLVNMRGLAVPHLERALKSEDIEVQRRAERCLQSIRSAPDAPQSAAMARLLAFRRPDDSAKTLLAYLAFADSDSVIDEIRDALRLLGRRDRTLTAVFRAGLADRSPQRRAMAAEMLAEMGGDEHLPALAKLLTDLEPLVRRRTAQGLAVRGRPEAVPVLIDLLGVLPLEDAFAVEDVLRRVAGDKSPLVVVDESQAARKKSTEAWAAWWKENGAKVDLAGLKRRAPELGLTIASIWESGSNKNWLIEMGRDRKERWKIDNLGYVFDFVVLPGNRLLMTENTGHRVTERTFTGEILWEYRIDGPINCQKLPNGHVFIVSSNQAVIVDRQKNVVLKVDRHSGLMGGQRFRDGRMVLVDGSGNCYLLDAKGAAIRQFQAAGGMSNYGGIQELPNGRFLLAQHHRNTVSEFDLEGNVMWKAETPSPNFATRLSNGHTAVGSQDNRSLVELDREGKLVSRYEPGASVWKVRRR